LNTLDYKGGTSAIGNNEEIDVRDTPLRRQPTLGGVHTVLDEYCQIRLLKIPEIPCETREIIVEHLPSGKHLVCTLVLTVGVFTLKAQAQYHLLEHTRREVIGSPVPVIVFEHYLIRLGIEN
jgi:hypothetical protein